MIHVFLLRGGLSHLLGVFGGDTIDDNGGQSAANSSHAHHGAEHRGGHLGVSEEISGGIIALIGGSE